MGQHEAWGMEGARYAGDGKFVRKMGRASLLYVCDPVWDNSAYSAPLYQVRCAASSFGVGSLVTIPQCAWVCAQRHPAASAVEIKSHLYLCNAQQSRRHGRKETMWRPPSTKSCQTYVGNAYEKTQRESTTMIMHYHPKPASILLTTNPPHGIFV